MLNKIWVSTINPDRCYRFEVVGLHPAKVSWKRLSLPSRLLYKIRHQYEEVTSQHEEDLGGNDEYPECIHMYIGLAKYEDVYMYTEGEVIYRGNTLIAHLELTSQSGHLATHTTHNTHSFDRSESSRMLGYSIYIYIYIFFLIGTSTKIQNIPWITLTFKLSRTQLTLTTLLDLAGECFYFLCQSHLLSNCQDY